MEPRAAAAQFITFAYALTANSGPRGRAFGLVFTGKLQISRRNLRYRPNSAGRELETIAVRQTSAASGTI
jgi:hypothetical protein